MGPKFHTDIRNDLRLTLRSNQVLVSLSNTEVVRSNDTNYPFRQNSNFYYLTGIKEPDCVQFITPMHDLLVLPDQSDVHQLWYGGQLDRKKAEEISGNTRFTALSDLSNYFKDYLKNKDILLVLSDQPHHNQIWRKRLKRYGVKSISTVDNRISRMRMIKQTSELKKIQNAVTVTKKAFKSLDVNNFNNEKQIEAYFTAKFHGQGHHHAYNPIIASGSNSCVLHYEKNSSDINKSQLLLIDVGAEVEGYCADITRTIPVDKVSKRHKNVLTAVLSVQKQAIEHLKPGMTMKEFAKESRKHLLNELQDLGLLNSKSSLDDTIEFMPHAISHHLGLDVHDLADYDAILEPNMVLTVEPGIYLPEEGIGVRIEDDVVVTENSCRVL